MISKLRLTYLDRRRKTLSYLLSIVSNLQSDESLSDCLAAVHI
jgi:hypothetical protein